MDPRVLYSLPFFIAAGSMAVVALFAVRRYKMRGAVYLILLCLSASIWAATEGMLYFGLNPETNMRITQVQYFGIAPLPPLVLLFGLTLFGFESWVTRTKTFLLLLIAIIIIVLVWTNPYHRLIFSDYYPIDTGPFNMLGLKHGPVWGVVLGYHYLLMAILSIILFRQVWTTSGYHRYQAGLVLSAIVVVWTVNFVYATGNSPIPNMDISPLAFTLVGGAMAWWGFYRFNLLDIMPVAKTEIFQGLDDAVLVLDTKDRVTDINPAAEALFNVRGAETIGRHASETLANYTGLKSALNGKNESEIVLPARNGDRIYDMGVSPLRDKKGVDLGKMIVFRDITRRKQMETEHLEREKLQGVVEMAGAVCHELNQPLQVISGYSELLAASRVSEAETAESLEIIQKEIQKMSAITQKLMRITKYKTKIYLDGQIIDIDESTE